MTITNITRNLRDGELVIQDGSGIPKSLRLLLDEGDLSWTQKQRTIEVKDRGSITAGHTRKGDDESVVVSFSAKWTQLLGHSLDEDDPLQLYEFLNFVSGLGLQSTSSAGEQNTLRMEFTVFDPAGVAHEKIVFSKVYQETLTLSEGNEFNLISFHGRDFESRPTVSRL